MEPTLPHQDLPQETPPLQRKPYVKPEVERYHLRVKEAVLGFCNSSSVAGAGNPSGCTAPTACIT